LFVLAGLTVAVALLCTLGLAIADRAQAAGDPPVSGQAASATTNFFAWRQSGWTGSQCSSNWGHGLDCAFSYTGYDLSILISATITNTTYPSGFVSPYNQLPSAIPDNSSIASTVISSTQWSAAADDFVITSTIASGGSEAITGLRVLGFGLTAGNLTGGSYKVNVCFYNNTALNPRPYNLPDWPPSCSNNLNLQPQNVTPGPGGGLANYFDVTLATPQVYPAADSGLTEWVSIQIVGSSEWDVILATYPWTNFLYLPFIRR
jgi:hypothetical protein